MMITIAFTTNPWLYSNMPFNSERDFASIAITSFDATLLAVHNSLPVQNVKELTKPAARAGKR